jgi:hypothetical protein
VTLFSAVAESRIITEMLHRTKDFRTFRIDILPIK